MALLEWLTQKYCSGSNYLRRTVNGRHLNMVQLKAWQEDLPELYYVNQLLIRSIFPLTLLIELVDSISRSSAHI